RRAGRAALQHRHADDLGLGGQQADHVVGVVAPVLLLAHEEDGVRGLLDQRPQALDDPLHERLAVDLDEVLRVLVARDLEHAAVAGHQDHQPHAATFLSLSAASMRARIGSRATSSGPSTTSSWAPAAVAALMPFSLSSTTT